jgi:hypothetical protein
MGALDSFLSYLRIPLLASSGIAALLSGVLYFKQKYTTSQRVYRLDTDETQ